MRKMRPRQIKPYSISLRAWASDAISISLIKRQRRFALFQSAKFCQPPALVRRRRLGAVFDNNDALITQQCGFSKLIHHGRIKTGRVRRVKEDKVKWFRFDRQLLKRGKRIAADQCSFAANAKLSQIRFDHATGATRLFNQDEVASPPAERFDADGARPRAQVKKAALLYPVAEYVKQGFAQSIRRWPHIQPRGRV